MNMKKLAFTGVLALVVIGCVLAAGCTSTSTQESSDPAIGIWILDTSPELVSYYEENMPSMMEAAKSIGFDISDYISVFVVNDDGTAKSYEIKKSDGSAGEHLANYTWKNDGSNRYSLTESRTGISAVPKFTVDPVKGTLVFDGFGSDNPAFTFYKQPSDASGAILKIIADKIYDDDGNVIGYIDAWGNEISLTPQSDE